MVVDIIIKSFNRPYYLERCIRSIYLFVEGSFKIKVLDDGTAPEYLNKIAALFPEVEIHRSPLYNEKVKAIRAHVQGTQPWGRFSIPTNFWIEHVRRATDYFLLLEDDIWLTNKINVSEVAKLMKGGGLAKIKIGWQGTMNVNKGKIVPLAHGVEEIKPVIGLANRAILNNWFKSASVLNILGFNKLTFAAVLPFYAIYYVAAAFFEKNYWLYLWEGAGEKVDEAFQLKKAYRWYKQKGSRFGKMERESAKTSYITSATNNFEGVDFNMINFNHHVNEAWLQGGFDAMEGFPRDFSVDYVQSILGSAADKSCSYAGWLQWIDRFKGMYRSFGCEVD